MTAHSGTADAVLILDRYGRIVHASLAIHRIFGFPPDELVGVPASVLIPKRLRERHQADFERFVADPEAAAEHDGNEISGRRRDGTEFPACLSWGTYTLNGERFFTAVIRDLSERLESERALRASEQRYRQLFEANVAGVYRATPDGNLLEVNDALAGMLGYDREELTRDTSVSVYFAESDRQRWVSELRKRSTLSNYVHRLKRKDGRSIWTLENASLLDDPETGEPVIVGTAIDLTERKLLEEKLERLAYRDPLTGLANRRMLREMTVSALSRASRDGTTVGMLYMDLVRFKRINDSFGHAVGDRVLFEAGERFHSVLRSTDMVARVGGDEFAVLLVGLEDLDAGLAPAEKLRESLARPFMIDGQTFHLEVRVGLAGYPRHATTFDELLSKADLGLHQGAPHSTDVAVYKPLAVGASREDIMLEERLRAALAEDEFELHFQPIFSVPSFEPVGAEALARWRMSNGKLISASDFITVAEHTGLVRQLDRWAISRAVDYIAEWPDRGPVWVALNLAPPTFEDPELPSHVAEELQRTGVEGSRLALEVTERVAMRDPVRAAATLRELQELGVQIVIDDFGRGHSSLAYLKDFPADALKVDRFFVNGVGRDRKHERLLEGIVALCKGLGVDLIAEGVESREQLDWLAAHGCSLVQGYFLAHPESPDALLDRFEPVKEPF